MKKVLIILFSFAAGCLAMDLPSADQAFAQDSFTVIDPTLMSPSAVPVSFGRSRGTTPVENSLFLALLQASVAVLPGAFYHPYAQVVAAQTYADAYQAFMSASVGVPQSVAAPVHNLADVIDLVDDQDIQVMQRPAQRRRVEQAPLAIVQPKAESMVVQKPVVRFKNPTEATEAVRKKLGNDRNKIHRAMVDAIAARGEDCAKEFGLWIPDDLL